MKLSLNFIIGIILIFGIFVYLNSKNINFLEEFINRRQIRDLLKNHFDDLESQIEDMSMDGASLNENQAKQKINILTEILNEDFFGISDDSEISDDTEIQVLIDEFIGDNYDENEKKIKRVRPPEVTSMVKLLNLFFEFVSNKLIIFFISSSLNDNLSENYKNTELFEFYKEITKLLEYIVPVYTKLRTIRNINTYDRFYIPDNEFIKSTINGLTVKQRQSLTDALKPKADN